MINITDDPRSTLEITRYHTWRVIRAQSNGEHSCQIQRIMLCIDPNVSRRLLIYAVLHDIDESVGDIPYPFKKNNPDLKAAFNRVALEMRRGMEETHHIPRLPVLDEIEEKFFKICEYIEMWEYGITEVNMGNLYAVLIAERCILAASNLMQDLPTPLQEKIKKYIANRMKQESTDVR